MSNLYYELYCDESGINRGGFYLGAMHCSRRRAKILSDIIDQFRLEQHMTSEMKWERVSESKLPQYELFADIFLNDPYASFIVSSVTKGRHWRKQAKSNNSKFLFAYFDFIEDAMWSSARYELTLDGFSIKQYKFDSLHYGLNKVRIGPKRQKKVILTKLADSKQNNLIQLVDVILGALTSTATSPHKRRLSEYVRRKIDYSTKSSGRPKLRKIEWATPDPEHRRFTPNL